jgi:hypothetical protein
MSVKLMSMTYDAAFPDVELEGHTVKASTAKSVCLALADHANEDGKGAYPSIQTLCDKTEYERRTVQRALDALIKQNIIKLAGVSEYRTDNYTLSPATLSVMKRNRGGDSGAEYGISGQNEGDSGAEKSVPESPESSINHPNNHGVVKEKANKTVDAILEQANQASKRLTYPKRESLPDPIRELIDEFVRTSGIKPMARETMSWLQAAQDWLNLGATAKDVRDALEYARGKFSVPTPFSLTNTLRERKAQPKDPIPEYHKPYSPEPEKANKMTAAEYKIWKESHGK